ncbi:MAG: hypothetical protein WBF34_32340 [Streptosporangiaceae bacterium]
MWQQEWVHGAPPGVPGGQDFDVHANWQAIAACVRAALRAAGADGADVAAVSATSMREGIVLYDAVGTDIWACPNVDSRASVEAAKPKPLIDPAVRLRTLCHVTPGAWMVEGIRFFCGVAMRWYRDASCDSEATVVRSRGVGPYVVMEEAAAPIPPGSNGVYAILSNLMNARRWTHASPSFLQFDLGNPAGSGRSACIRAIEEAAAYVVRGHFDIICGLTAWRRDRGKERKADSDIVIDAERFSLDVSARSRPYDLKGSGALDWGMQSRLARIFRPPAIRTVMLAIDHGYFQDPTNGLERVDLSIVPLLKYADALTATRGIVRTTIPAASRTPVVLRACGGPASCVSCPTSRSRSAWRTRPGSTLRRRPCRCSSAGSSSHARCTT